MKKLLIVALSILGIIACLAGLTACSGKSYYGTYYSGYPNDATSSKLVITRDTIKLGSVECAYVYYSDNSITLTTGDRICFAEEDQVAYFPLFKWQYQGSITVRNGYFNAQLTIIADYQLISNYQFNKDGTFRFVNVDPAKITTGTYNLKDGVLSIVNKNETGSSGSLTMNKLYFWYIDESYNIFGGAMVKDYTKFQNTSNESSNGNGENNKPGGNDENPDNEKPPVYEPHTLTYDFNYYGVNTITQQVTKNEYVNLISPKLDGYKFLGWYDDMWEKYESGVWQLDSDVTLFAHWEAIVYSITYNTNGGTLPDNCLKSFTVASYDLPYTLPIPTKQDFNFVGWYESPDFSGEQITTIPKNSLQNYVLYAKYSDEEVLEYEMSFDETYYSIVGYKGTLQYITVPERKDGLPVKEIAAGAFKNCNTLINIIIPDSICKIGVSAFHGCSKLTSVIMGNSITRIGERAFYDCSELTTIVIPDSVTSIDDYTFAGCSNLTSVIMGNSITRIGVWAFRDCSELTTIVIPDSVTSIDDYAFLKCSNLTSVIMGNSITRIGVWAFRDSSRLASIIIPDSVTYIATAALPDNLYKRYNGCYYLPTKNSEYGFLYCVIASDITNIKIHSECQSINSSAFEYCKNLTSIVIPDGVMAIANYTFAGCSNLTSVTLPNSVTSIGEDAFEGCSSLASVYYTGDIAGWCNISFDNVYANPLKYAHNLYIDNELVTELAIPETITEIKPHAFSSTSVASVVIPDSVTSIGYYAFNYCSGLSRVFYKGTAEDWTKISIGSNNNNLNYFTLYYYSETEPDLNADGTAYDGKYWHYDTDGITPVVWNENY